MVALLSLGILVTSIPGYIDIITRGFSEHGPQAEPSSLSITLQAVNGVASLASSLLSLFLARLLFRDKFENPTVAVVSFYLLLYSIVMTGVLEAWGSYWTGTSGYVINLQTLLLGTPTLAVLVLFPNGRFIPSWTRWLLVASIAWTLVYIVNPIFPYSGNLFDLVILGMSWLFLFGSGFIAQAIRFRKFSTPNERQQTKWIAFGFGLWIAYMLISTIPYVILMELPPDSTPPWWAPLSELGWWLSMSILPVTLTIAITRSRLWNINIVINRTLVYGTLTFLTITGYVIIVGVLGNIIRIGNNNIVAFLAAGLVAVLFQPLRDRLQHSINRLMFGERDDPVAVLTRLGEQLEYTGSPEDALTDIVKTVARALKLPYVAIELKQQEGTTASYGLPRSGIIRLPLVYQSETFGYLLVATRSPGEEFNSSDLQLLDNISHQAGAAAHNAKLTADLRLSRQKLVTAREEERRRLRRDLHDGLGPTLASLTLKLDAARNLLVNDPHKAELLLDDLKKQTQDTIQNIRNLVYGLRPPALDELGLVGAIQSFIDAHTLSQTQLILNIPDPLPIFPAAIEVAVYRIILESLTNVFRHAQASQVSVSIQQSNKMLYLEISDNGTGIPEGMTPGVGLVSMQERAEELGGTFSINNPGKGTLVRVCLPFLREIN